MRSSLAVLSFFCGGLVFCQCSPGSTTPVQNEFTKADSLTDYYLSLQDSLHQIWNVMISSDNQKIDAMHGVVHELMTSHPEQLERLKEFEEKIDQLLRMRYTQKSLSNADVIVEYDVAAHSILTDLVATVQATREFSYNKTLQKLLEQIRTSDAQMLYHRQEYDSLVRMYNVFVESNKEYLLQNDESFSVEKKSSFRMVSEK